jgi:hypothetical protein
MEHSNKFQINIQLALIHLLIQPKYNSDIWNDKLKSESIVTEWKKQQNKYLLNIQTKPNI